MTPGTHPGAAWEAPRTPAAWAVAAFAIAALIAGTGAGFAAVALPQPLLAVAGAVGLLVAVLMVADAGWAVGTMAAFAVLNLANVATDFHGAPSVFQPLLALVALGIAVRWATRGERPVGGGRAAVFVGLYAAVALASLLAASDFAAGRFEAENLLKDGALAVVAGLLLRRTAMLRRVVWVMVTCGALLAAITAFQFLTGSFGTSFLGFGQTAVQNIVGGVDDVRISGPIGDPNFYAQLLVMLTPLALDRAFAEARRSRRLAAWGAAALMAASIVFTFSRGGILALGVVVLLMLLRRPARWRALAALVLAAALAVPFLPPGYMDRLTALGQVGTVESNTDVSIRGRTAEAGAGWAMFMDHPLTGVGVGNYSGYYQEYARSLGIEVKRVDREPHSLFLEVAAETGLPGLAAFGAMLGGAFWALGTARRRWRAAARAAEADLAYALGAALVGWLATSVFLHLDFARPFWLLLGLAFALPHLAEGDAGPAPQEER
ncbi:MAG: O-antigen ligase family protein [Acidimicrobiia bacterium]|nr:O-antigen ligase family protein [Acidimicrobiia bacterium]